MADNVLKNVLRRLATVFLALECIFLQQPQYDKIKKKRDVYGLIPPFLVFISHLKSVNHLRTNKLLTILVCSNNKNRSTVWSISFHSRCKHGDIVGDILL